MSSAQGTTALERAERRGTTFAALFFGVPLSAGFLALFCFDKSPLHYLPQSRYFHNPVEWVEVVLFCCALSALGTKLWRHFWEGRAAGIKPSPAWDGKPIAAREAASLLGHLSHQPKRIRNSLLGRRVVAALDFVRQRGSADGLDDQLRALTDNDTLALESSYSLVRFLTWALPILGFLGTVLGITQSISGITPEKLEHDLSSVTDGLALAFDATALALGMTMITMFCSFLVERAEQGALDAVDRYIDRELAHRFERTVATGNPLAESTQRHADLLVKATEALVTRQADAWAKAAQEADRKRIESETKVQDRVAAALETALERTIQSHAQRLNSMERQAQERGGALVKQMEGLAVALRDQQAVVGRVTESLASQAKVIAQLQAGEAQLAELQASLDRNLEALASAGTFDQALQSLTAAIHLLTARAGEINPAARLGVKRPGAAA
jgi:biopolymer transport protein ExbB/TolQ